jgi:hypothetical protein
MSGYSPKTILYCRPFKFNDSLQSKVAKCKFRLRGDELVDEIVQYGDRTNYSITADG